MDTFLGASASGGISIGKAFVIPDVVKRIIPQSLIKTGDHEKEWKRLEKSLKIVSDQVAKDLDSVKDDKVQSEIFQTYFMMLQDVEFLKDLRKSFEADNHKIEYALDLKAEEYADKLRKTGNEYLAQRAQDIIDIFGRVLDDLLDYHPFNIDSVPDGVVIVAKSMNPSDTIILSKRNIIGLALTEGGVSSHVGILARNYGIPAVFALHRITEHAKSGCTIIVDGDAGETIINPDSETTIYYNEKIEKQKAHRLELEQWRGKPALSKDGHKFQILANIGTVEEAKMALEEGADGIGLFRTEFLFMSESDEKNPVKKHLGAFSEDSQFEAYRSVLETMGDRPVTIRTLDAGGDKALNIPDMQLHEEKNPLMGLRAIRLSLSNERQLKTQFRALYRASAYGNLKIMLPLITDVEQVKKSKELAAQVREELASENIPFNPDVPIGIMVETAAAALTADCLAAQSDFFSIGTNDLTQYTIGVDRENAAVAPLYDEFHLAVLRLIDNTIKESKKAKIPLSVCGEMASRTNSVLVLAGMGVRQLSMSPMQITEIKKLLSRFTIEELQGISSKRLNSL